MYVDGQTIVKIAGIIAAVSAIITLFWKMFTWIQRQKDQDKEIASLKETQKKDRAEILEEQTLITFGLLACLKGLAEQGCNGPVTDAINRIEKHINKRAHDQD
ncbi:MAG: branched-chain amino acid ABC transporter permease [Clostridia bacterium]|nr:branched-chain amino acid ABC transporter permease [Clostridia bacterium]